MKEDDYLRPMWYVATATGPMGNMVKSQPHRDPGEAFRECEAEIIKASQAGRPADYLKLTHNMSLSPETLAAEEARAHLLRGIWMAVTYGGRV